MAEADSIRQAIEERNREFVAAFNRGDAAGVAANYTEDARVLPPGAPMVRGRQAIEQFWQSIMSIGVREVDLQTEDVEATGDLAYEFGAATLKIQSASGPLTTDTVKYI